MRSVVATVLLSLLILWQAGPAQAEGMINSVNGDLDELEMFAAPDSEDVALTIKRDQLVVPQPILAVDTDYGMLKLQHDGAEYWVLSDDVVTDVTRDVDAATCAPKVAGTLVIHGKKGAKDCK